MATKKKTSPTKKPTNKKISSRNNRSLLSRLTQKYGRGGQAIIFAAVFAILGTVYLFFAHAAVYTASPSRAQAWDNLAPQMRACESGGNYSINTGNGFYGAYQFDYTTWRSYAGYTKYGYPRADLAPKPVQDYAAYQLYLARGTGPWPVCGQSASRTTYADSTGCYGGPSLQPSWNSGCHTPTTYYATTGGGGGSTSPNTNLVDCSASGSYSGHTEYHCNFSLPTPLWQGNTQRGNFKYQSSNWILCQQSSSRFYKSSTVWNSWWGYSLSDENTWGWVNATYATTGGNGGAYGYASRTRTVPSCSSLGIKPAVALPTVTHP